MPTVPSCLLEPIWDEFHALIGDDPPEFDPTHPLGCHRRRIPNRMVFEHLIDALVHGSGYERIATAECSDRTIRRRLKEWAQAGLAQRIHAIALAAYDRIIGLRLQDLPVDGCITKAPCGGDKAGRSPVDRGKSGLKRSVATEAAGIPLGIVSAGANRHDSPLLAPTLAAAQAQVGSLPEQVQQELRPDGSPPPAAARRAQPSDHATLINWKRLLGRPEPVRRPARTAVPARDLARVLPPLPPLPPTGTNLTKYY